jgi:hypothetical protein
MLAFACFGLSGCVDGPLFGLKRMNPYFQSQWKEDRERGVVYRQRQQEMDEVRKQLPNMEREEQARWSSVVSKVYDEDTSPEMRRSAVLTLQKSPHPDAEAALIRACSDKNDKVRQTACKALAGRNSPAASQKLAAIAQTDKNMSVRYAALQSLGTFDSQEARMVLRNSLDEKTPGLQYHATLALKTMTGQDYGGDVESWKKFMDGQPTEESTASLAELQGEANGIQR